MNEFKENLKLENFEGDEELRKLADKNEKINMMLLEMADIKPIKDVDKLIQDLEK